MADRDPRIDPIAGDVCQNPGGQTFYVLDTCGDLIRYQEYIGEMETVILSDWREFAKNDTVIKRGDADHG